MSVPGKRDYRPLFHYSPVSGWINDPNGLIFDGEKYHLFAQYYPYGTFHGPMYWSHAVSKDLLHWEHLPTALSPDKNGDCWSGSACMLNGNIALMYTSAAEAQAQSVAFTNDGVNFTQYEGNPVIKNPGIHDYRDPKLFFNKKYGKYGVAVAAGDHVEFFVSDDLIRWEKTGEFSDQARVTGIHECPDVFELSAPSGETVHCMIASMIKPGKGNCTEYALGSFDGDKFVLDRPFDSPEPIDHGYDMYAPVTFWGTDSKIMIGWASNWAYAHKQPTGDYAGIMSFPRELGLITTQKGLRLTQKPLIDAITGGYAETSKLPGEAFRIRLRAKGDFALTLKNDIGEALTLSLKDGVYTVDRRSAGEWGEATEMAGEFGAARRERLIGGGVEMDICFDVSVLEAFGDLGSYFSTTLVYPTKPYTDIIKENCECEVAPLK